MRLSSARHSTSSLPGNEEKKAKTPVGRESASSPQKQLAKAEMPALMDVRKSMRKRIKDGLISTVKTTAQWLTPLAKPQLTFQPAFGTTLAEEYAIFKQQLSPFRGLPKDQQEKAALLLIRDRFRVLVSHAQQHKGVSPADCITMCERWAAIARAEELLPKTSVLRVLQPKGQSAKQKEILLHYSLGDGSAHPIIIDRLSDKGELSEKPCEQAQHLFRDFPALIQTQENWIRQHGYPGLPDDFDNTEGYQHYIQLIEAQRLIGTVQQGRIISADDLLLTPQQRHILLGVYSNHYGRNFTEKDLGLDVRKSSGEKARQDDLAAMGINLGTDDKAVNLSSQIFDNALDLALPFVAEQIKLMKIKQRRKVVVSAYKISQHRERELLKNLKSPAVGQYQFYTDDEAPDVSADVKRLVEFQALLMKQGRHMSEEESALFIDDLCRVLTIDRNQPDFNISELGIDRQKVNGLRKENKSSEVKLKINLDKLWRFAREKEGMLPDLFALSPCTQPMDQSHFQQFATVCFLAKDRQSKDGSSINPVVDLLKMNDCFVNVDSLKDLVSAVLSLYPVSGNESAAQSFLSEMDRQELINYVNNLEGEDAESIFQDKKQLKQLNSLLKKIGVHIDYKTDKQPDDLDKTRAVYHRVSIDTEKTYQLLKKMGQLPYSGQLDALLRSHKKDIKALYSLREYDQWKINHHKAVNSLMWGALSFEVVPLPVPVSDILETVAYKKEVKYRKKGVGRMRVRVVRAISALPFASSEAMNNKPEKKRTRKGLSRILSTVTSFFSRLFIKEERRVEKQRQHFIHDGWEPEEVSTLVHLLKSARKVKENHTNIKKNKARADAANAATSAVLSPVDAIMPLRVGAKYSWSIASSASAFIAREKVDKKLKQEKQYATVIDIYKFYKQLYRKALSDNNTAKMNQIEQLAKATFGLPVEGFQALVKTDLIEDHRFKLSFSRPEDMAYKGRLA